MATVAFISGLEPILKNDGTLNAAGTVEFYAAGTAFATPKAVYADSGLVTSLGSIITLNSAATLSCYLDGDYDIKIKDSGANLVRSVYNINPTTSTTATDPTAISNASFENAALTNWTLFEWNVGTTVVDNVDQDHGAYSVKFTSAGGGGGYITSALFPCTPERVIQIGFNIKSNVANVRNIVQIRWYDKSQAFLSSTTLYDDSATNPTSWTAKQYSTTPPATAVFGAVRLIGCDSSVATAGNTRFDDVRVLESMTGLLLLASANTWTGTQTFTNTLSFSGAGKWADNSLIDAMIASLGRFQIFTANGNFTAPKTGNYLIIAIGGGGGGGGGSGCAGGVGPSSGCGGQGGGGGELAVASLALTATTVYPVVIGALGTGGGDNTDGNAGTSTTFNTAGLVAGGGVGGRRGGYEHGGQAGATISQGGGTGGGYGGGQGGAGVAEANGSAGSAATGYGAGGGGGSGAATNNTARTGGSGASGKNGILIVFW